MQPVRNLAPQDYAQLRQDDVRPMLIDVREPWEFALAHIDGAELMPLGQIQEWSAKLDKAAAYVVVCHHGSRSGMACHYLQTLGFKDVRNLDGGINAWSIAVDPKIPRY